MNSLPAYDSRSSRGLLFVGYSSSRRSKIIWSGTESAPIRNPEKTRSTLQLARAFIVNPEVRDSRTQKKEPDLSRSGLLSRAYTALDASEEEDAPRLSIVEAVSTAGGRGDLGCERSVKIK